MSKVAIVFWSGTGNTEAMAEIVTEAAKGAGAEAEMFDSSSYDDFSMDDFDAVAFGCPSMGSEELEDGEFLPFFEGIEDALSGKKIALFGSYGWGDGEWMRNWEESCREKGAELVIDPVICEEAPDDDAEEALKALGEALAK